MSADGLGAMLHMMHRTGKEKMDMHCETDLSSSADRARRLFDEHADAVAGAAVAHLRIHYPAALDAVPRTAQTSLRNSIKAQVRSRFGPLLRVMIALEQEWDA